MNNNPAPTETDLHIYATIADLEARLDPSVLRQITDPYKFGVPEERIVRQIEEAGSIDLNLALYSAKIDGVFVLDGFAGSLAKLIAVDAMVAFVARNHPDIIGLPQHAVDALVQQCKERTASLVAKSQNTMQPTQSIVEGWYIVEMMGQKRFSAWIRTVQVAGQTMLELQIPMNKSKPDERAIKYIGSRNAIYAITPCDDRIALGIAHRNKPLPIDSWELRSESSPDPQLSAGSRDDDADHDDDPFEYETPDSEPSGSEASQTMSPPSPNEIGF